MAKTVRVPLDKLHEEKDRLKLVLNSFPSAKTRLPQTRVSEIFFALSNVVRQHNSQLTASSLRRPEKIMVEINEGLWNRAIGIM